MRRYKTHKHQNLKGQDSKFLHNNYKIQNEIEINGGLLVMQFLQNACLVIREK